MDASKPPSNWLSKNKARAGKFPWAANGIFAGYHSRSFPLFGPVCGTTGWLNPGARSEMDGCFSVGTLGMRRSLPIALMMFVIIELGGFSKASAGVLNTDGFTIGPCYRTTTLTWSPIFSANTETPAPEPF
jgi:hypothetical protein